MGGRRLVLIGLPALALSVLSACGDQTGSASSDTSASAVVTPTVMPRAVPIPAGPVRTREPVTVLDHGPGAELCVGFVAQSLPPQCGGPKLIGWDWSQHQGDFESRGPVRWGDFEVTGTFDGSDFTATSVVPSSQASAAPPSAVDLTTPCPTPPGGWRAADPGKVSQADFDRTAAAAKRLDGFTSFAVDTTTSTYEIVDVEVTGDPAVAEDALRDTWGGPLCVTRAAHTEAQLERIQSQVRSVAGWQGSGLDFSHVDLFVIYDDGSIQAWADHAFGAGTVVVSSALVDVK